MVYYESMLLGRLVLAYEGRGVGYWFGVQQILYSVSTFLTTLTYSIYHDKDLAGITMWSSIQNDLLFLSGDR